MEHSIELRGLLCPRADADIAQAQADQIIRNAKEVLDRAERVAKREALFAKREAKRAANDAAKLANHAKAAGALAKHAAADADADDADADDADVAASFWTTIGEFHWQLSSGGPVDTANAPVVTDEFVAEFHNHVADLRALGVDVTVAEQVVLLGEQWYTTVVENPDMAEFVRTELQPVRAADAMSRLA